MLESKSVDSSYKYKNSKSYVLCLYLLNTLKENCIQFSIFLP